MSNTSVLRGRDQETFLLIDLTGSTGRTLSAVETLAKTIRFTGTLGQSIILRVPLSQDDKGVSYTFENATSGGFEISVRPLSGIGVDIAFGGIFTAFYDGTALVAAGGGSIGGIPVNLTDPQIGDAISFDGDEWVNGPVVADISGAVILTPNSDQRNVIQPSVAGVVPLTLYPSTLQTNTTAVTLIERHDTQGVVAAGFGIEHKYQIQSSTTAGQDAATRRVTWSTATHASRKARLIDGVFDTAFREAIRHDTTGSRALTTLGDGTVSGTARLYVRDDANAELATFEGGTSLSSVFMLLGPGSAAALRIYPQDPATSGATLLETGGLLLRAHYWNGSSSQSQDGQVRMRMDAVTPVSYLTLAHGNHEAIFIKQNGQVIIAPDVTVPTAPTEKFIVSGSARFISGTLAIEDNTDVVLGTAIGTRIGSTASEFLALWGGVRGVQMAVSGTTDVALLDSLLSQMALRGFIGAYTAPATLSWFVFFDSRNVTGAHDAAVATWPESFNSRDATQSTGGFQPKVQVTSNTSPNGSRRVRFDGIDDQLGRVVTMPGNTTGWYICGAGTWRAAGAGPFPGSQLFAGTDNFPAVTIEHFSTHQVGWIDTGGTHNIAAFSAGRDFYEWVFNPPSGSGACDVYKNGTLLGSATWTQTGGGAGFFLSGNAVQNVALDADLEIFGLATSIPTAAQRAGLRAWWTARFG